jgi:hypothetical protein
MAILSSGLPDHVDDSEILARFLTSSSQYSSSGVKHSAFLPSATGRETSVSRHGPEPREDLWSIGREAAGVRNLHGAALLKAITIRQIGLDIFPDEPPPKHAAIRNWPWDESDPEMRKARHKALALLLPESAELLVI